MAKTAELGSLLAEVRDSGDFDRLVRVIPYARKLGMTVGVEEVAASGADDESAPAAPAE